MDNFISVKDKTILVTGAFGLIGKEICRHFIGQGANVILADNNASQTEVVEHEMATVGSANFLITHLDITDADSVQTCIDAGINKFGQIDVLINNAPIDAKFDREHTKEINVNRFERYPIELLRHSTEVNLIGTVQMTQAACRQMLKQGSGNIINVASTYSLVAPNQQLYNLGEGEPIRYKPIDYIATKSFVPNYTRYLATFYAKDGIRCNAIVPHGVYNNHDEKFLRNFAQYSPLGRMCDKSELTGPFTFLASDASSYMTGSILVVDGGWTAW